MRCCHNGLAWVHYVSRLLPPWIEVATEGPVGLVSDVGRRCCCRGAFVSVGFVAGPFWQGWKFAWFLVYSCVHLSCPLEGGTDGYPCDYTHDAMNNYMNKGSQSRNDRDEFLLPISFDLPLTQDGMRLSIYLWCRRTHRQILFQTTIEVEVPFRCMLIWRYKPSIDLSASLPIKSE